MIKCCECQQNKQKEEFSKDKYRTNGYSIYCKECANNIARVRRERKTGRKSQGSHSRLPSEKFNRKIHQKKYYEENKAYYTAKSAERRLKKSNGTLNNLFCEETTEIYKEARIRNMVVDHIDPINHPLICGLHVPKNLQIMSKEENAEKSNKFIPYTIKI